MSVTDIAASLRETAEQSGAWPFEEARKIVARLKKKPKDEVIFETGYGPSGLPHIGTFGEVDLLFGDGISLAFWLNGTDSSNCCVFRGGAFLESKFFGEGVGIAVRRGNDLMRQAFNWALFRLWESGRFTDLWLRYFPISPF